MHVELSFACSIAKHAVRHSWSSGDGIRPATALELVGDVGVAPCKSGKGNGEDIFDVNEQIFGTKLSLVVAC